VCPVVIVMVEIMIKIVIKVIIIIMYIKCTRFFAEDTLILASVALNKCQYSKVF
jgi:hypothetical protein